MTQIKVPARLDILLAPKARKAVVLRRGPTKLVCTVGWDLSNDTFELGQWIKGRIYAYCCDLSPDGGYFLYFTMKAKPIPGEWAWTAISRAPYLKAIGRWAVMGGHHGGGVFLSNRKFWLNNSSSAFLECNELTQETSEMEDEFRREWQKVYYRRLIHVGWRLVKKPGLVPGRGNLTFEKPLGENRLLVNIVDPDGLVVQGRGTCSSEYRLNDYGTGAVQFQPSWTWADCDDGRLLWAEGGKIFSADIQTGGLGPAKMLHDFNDMTFQEIEAPY